MGSEEDGMSGKLPYYKRFPKDYLSDENVVVMTLEEEGAYNRLMDYCWLQGSIPNDLGRLAKLCGVGRDKMAEIWPAVEKCFRDSGPDRLVHPRLDKERRKALNRKKKLSEAGKKGREKQLQDNDSGATPGPPPSQAQGRPGHSQKADTETEGTTTEDKSSGASPVVENSGEDAEASVGAVVAPLLRKRWWQSKTPPPKAPPKWNMGREINVCERLIEKEGWTLSSLGEALAEYEGPPATLAIVQKEGNRHVLYRLMEKVKQRERLAPSKVGDVLKELAS